MWKFGVSEVTTWPWSFANDVMGYADLGADAIEIWEFKLARDPQRRREQIASVAAHGMTVSSFQADVHTVFPTLSQPDPADLATRRDALLHTLTSLGPLLPGTVFVLNTGLAPGGNVQAAFDAAIPVLHDLATRAAEVGVRLALEPLHPFSVNADTFAWHLEDARDIVDAVGNPVLGLCADAWNLAGQHDLERRLASCVDKIFLAQVSDYRRPRSALDRLAVGDGSLDFRPFFAGLAAARYCGPIVLEIFSKDVTDSLYDGDLSAVISRSRNEVSRLISALS